MRNARIAGLIALCVAAACADDPRISQPEPVVRPARMLVEAFVRTSGDELRARVDSLATRRRLTERIRNEAKRPWNARLEGGIKYADLFEVLYLDEARGLAFASRDGLTARGVATLDELRKTKDQGLDPSSYHLDQITKLQASLATTAVPDDADFSLRGDEAEAAVEWLQRNQGDYPDEASARTALLDVLVGEHRDAPLVDRIGVLAEERRKSVAPRVDKLVELELRVADGALRAARDIRLFNYKRVSWPELERRGGGKKVIYERLTETFSDLTVAEPPAVSAVFDGIRPDHPQYNRLVDALVRYRAIEARGGWPEVAPFEIGAKTSGPSVDALRRRLAIEGYLVGSLPTEGAPVDDALWAAIRAYQATHQFAEGSPTPGFWRSLNLPIERRIAQIELNLQRWRDSYFAADQDFIFVNIPDFHAEVYRQGERRMRFKVVVGNNNRTCDPSTRRWKYPNATPVQWSELEHLMLNPWWNVPDRLFREEIAPKMEDAQWLAEKGYEIYERDGTLRARQRPGENNALGLVKFIFPNPHSTFMHDTPLKKYFDYPVRPFSHGCVRVSEPLELASYLMTEYDLGGRERIDGILESGSTIKVEFEQKIPVFFEYLTTRVDDEGHVNFLADPYHRDDEAFGNEKEIVCTPAAAAKISPPSEGQPDQSTPEEAAEDLGP